MGRPPSDARQRALEAAVAIVHRDGASSLTMDAVAKEAGVSKGGVLHHFPTKDALVLAVVERLTTAWEAAVQARAEMDPQPVGRFVRAFLDTMTDPALTTIGRGLLAAVALNPALLDPMRATYHRCQQRIANDGLDLASAYQCVLVADALWYGAIFDLPPPPKEVLADLRARLVASTRQPCP